MQNLDDLNLNEFEQFWERVNSNKRYVHAAIYINFNVIIFTNWVIYLN